MTKAQLLKIDDFLNANQLTSSDPFAWLFQMKTGLALCV